MSNDFTYSFHFSNLKKRIKRITIKENPGKQCEVGRI